ncbi:pyridoxal phosphate-dependent transferase [Pavlovales sp. CCMP2436]|nr:pyridoxal phosphate-dependent transferase [Pavlovales sp. CCMP2436]|mmetsp:Transcript_25107/g.63737  ORF Transcript_25107/g.63737 Transcript_25107/m.63737 type:complete len:427 (-) Transcript_25107:229-1509(-)
MALRSAFRPRVPAAPVLQHVRAFSNVSDTLINIPKAKLAPPPDFGQLNPPPRLMLGPGPSNAWPRVYTAMATPMVGHMDAHFIKLMEEAKDMLRYTWQTSNMFTIPVSGTGSAAWEAAHANLTEYGDVTLCAVNGYFGERAVDMSSRYTNNVVRIDRPWGEVFSLAEIREAFAKYKPQIFWIAHAETSTGACQPLEGIAALCKEYDCLLMADTVTSIGGVPLFIDDWGVDAAYAGGQKALGIPPGMAPLTFGERALEKMRRRKEPVKNWYLDMNMIIKYMVADGSGAPRSYHHTAPVSMLYAFREGLKILNEEGLENSWKRHRETGEFFWEGLKELGLEPHVAHENRLPTLTTVKIPEGVDGKAVVKHCLDHYNIEIAGGLGALAGVVWRIGFMGYNSKKENVLLLCAAFKSALKAQGKYPLPRAK